MSIEKFWRDATAADVTQVMNGETVEARFRDSELDAWWMHGSTLGGWKNDNLHWLDGDRTCWIYCQVYDPPQCWLDKPDPGEGYRLLDKFPDEDLQPGDEVFDLRGDEKWEPSFNAEIKQPQGEGIWYRRKIEQPKPEPRHYTLQVGDTAETPSGHRIKVTENGIKVQ